MKEMRHLRIITPLMFILVLGTGTSEATIGWYYISFDNQGNITHNTLGHPQISDPISTSTGDGEGWHYYPASDRYIMWFPNGPYSTNNITDVEMWGFIGAVDFSRSVSYDITMGWTTPAWTHSGTPPMPSDMSSVNEEETFIVERGFNSSDGVFLGAGTIESSRSYTTDNYNPAWLFVSVSGRNIMLFRWLDYQSIANNNGPSGGTPEPEVDDDVIPPEDEETLPVSIPVPVPPSHPLSTPWRQPAQQTVMGSADISGWTIQSSWSQGPLVLDDWSPTGVHPIRGFRWWGVFDTWHLPTMPDIVPAAFHVSVWSHHTSMGHPDVLLWEKTLSQWSWAYSGQLDNTSTPSGGDAVFECLAFLSQDQWFMPEGGPDTHYWIGFSPVYQGSTPTTAPWEWLARRPMQLSPAVTINQVGSWTTGSIGMWPPTVGQTVLVSQPLTGQTPGPWDMAFELISNQASNTTNPEGTFGDLNGDGMVNFDDLRIITDMILN